jgi:hypothetical protein
MSTNTASTECTLDGVTYSILVERDEHDVTHLIFASDPPPQGMHRERYSWHGNLKRMASA